MIRRLTAVFTALALFAVILSGAGTGAAGIGAYTKTVRNGSTGSAVVELQEALSVLGYYTGRVDGRAGAMTSAAIKAFQADHGLNPTGICERVTWAALMGEQTPGSAQASPPTEPETPEPEAPDISPLDDPEYVRIKKTAMAEILDMFEKITRMLEEALE